MTPFPYSVGIDEPLETAARKMSGHGFRHLPVMDGSTLVGVLSERLLRQAVERAKSSGHEATVRDVAMSDAYVVGLEERLDSVVLGMAERHVGAALVVKNDRLAGIFTSTDACRYLGELLRSEFPLGGGDEVA